LFAPHARIAAAGHSGDGCGYRIAIGDIAFLRRICLPGVIIVVLLFYRRIAAKSIGVNGDAISGWWNMAK